MVCYYMQGKSNIFIGEGESYIAPTHTLVIEVIVKFLLFLSHIIRVDSLKPEGAGFGSSSCAGFPLMLPPLFLQQPPSLTTDRWPWCPVGSASHLCLFIGFASFLNLRSSPEFHLFWPLKCSNLRWLVSGPRLQGTSVTAVGGVIFPFFLWLSCLLLVF